MISKDVVLSPYYLVIHQYINEDFLNRVCPSLSPSLQEGNSKHSVSMEFFKGNEMIQLESKYFIGTEMNSKQLVKYIFLMFWDYLFDSEVTDLEMFQKSDLQTKNGLDKVYSHYFPKSKTGEHSLFQIILNESIFLKDLTSKTPITEKLSGKIHLRVVFNERFFRKNKDFNLAQKIDLRSSQEEKMIVSLQKCLQTFCSYEKLDEDNTWTCPKCCKPQQALIERKILSFPDNLVISFKRFKQLNKNNKLVISKQSDLVDFSPNNIDFSPFSFNKKRSVFRLYAVINHFGSLE